jgi:hypothetical protein
MWFASPIRGVRGRGAILEHTGRAEMARLAVLAGAVPSVAWLVANAVDPSVLANDFHSYWYAGRLVAEGSSPYDLDALHALAQRQNDVFLLGTGYSYPLPFALAMVPLSGLPFDLAVVVFTVLSIAAFSLAVAGWLGRFHASAPPARLRLAALAAGTLPPICGSVLNGQVNLLVVAALALGSALVLERSAPRSAIGGVAIGLTAVVKLVPGVLAAPLWLAGRRGAAVAGLGAGVLVPLALAALLLPDVALDSGKLALLFRPDPYITNQSINGFVSRLVETSDRMTSLAPGAFDPAPIAALLTLGLAVATGLGLWGARRRMATADGLALGLAFALVAATAGAPKTSFWNVALVLGAVGLLLAVAAPDLDLRRLGRVERRLIAAWWASAVLQPLVWAVPAQPAGPAAAILVALGSVSLYGTLGLWWLLRRRLACWEPSQAGRPARA